MHNHWQNLTKGIELYQKGDYVVNHLAWSHKQASALNKQKDQMVDFQMYRNLL